MNNRQNGRRRGRNTNGGGNNPRPQSGPNRNHDQGNRIDSRARGNAAQLLEKYRNMARDAQLSGDRVMTEYYLQFADHYFRVLSDARLRQEEQRARFEDRDDGQGGTRPQAESNDLAEDADDTLDAIDMIGRAPRNMSRQRDPQRDGQRDSQRSEPRVDPRRGAERDADGNRADRPAAVNGHAPADASVEPGTEAAGDFGGEQRRYEPRGERPPRRERQPRPDRVAAQDDDGATGIDVAVLPPAIGIDPARVEAPAPSPASDSDAVSDEAPPPRRRGRPRKVVIDDGGAPA